MHLHKRGTEGISPGEVYLSLWERSQILSQRLLDDEEMENFRGMD
jgi:hypothetical protein